MTKQKNEEIESNSTCENENKKEFKWGEKLIATLKQKNEEKEEIKEEEKEEFGARLFATLRQNNKEDEESEDEKKGGKGKRKLRLKPDFSDEKIKEARKRRMKI